MAAPALIASIFGEPAVIVALIALGSGIAVRLAPKTRSEAGVDRAKARVDDATAWGQLLDRAMQANEKLEEKVDELTNALEEERAECDRKIARLEQRVDELEDARQERLFFRE